ncbi:hypothetical protein L7F22_044041 [Adiantum nelumboides]|nr:hypothetical protein [Adiantum nelumboides]
MTETEDTNEYVGASANQVLFHAITSGNVDLLQEILQGGKASGGKKPNLEARNPLGDTPVLASLRAGQLDILAVLLEEEVDVDEAETKHDGDRPLHLAVRLEDDEQREWTGSDPRLTNNDGFKPVDILTAGEQNEKVRRLLRDAEAISGFNKADVVDEDEESDGGPPSDED